MMKHLYRLLGIVVTATALIWSVTDHLSAAAEFPSAVADIQVESENNFTRITTSTDSTRDSWEAELSDDGTKIVFESDSDLLGEGISDGPLQIWLYDSSTMTYTRITTSSDSNRDSEFPAISSDGTKIVFQSDSDFFGEGIENFQSQIWLYDTTTMTLTGITADSDPDRASLQPSINGDGTKIVFHSDADLLGEGIGNDQYQVWLYDTTTMTYTRITTSSESNRVSLVPVINRDGTKIVFYSDSDFFGEGIPDNQFDVWLYDTTTMTLTRITTVSDSNRDSSRATISDDGTKIAFRSDSDFFGEGIPDGQIEIWLYDTTTMTLTRVAPGSDSDRYSWYSAISGDGTTIVFESDSDLLGEGIPDQQFHVWLYDISTKALTRISSATDLDRDNGRPAINRDGTQIVFHGDSDYLDEGVIDNDFQIWLWNRTYDSYLPFLQK